jgi:hypothetical protein
MRDGEEVTMPDFRAYMLDKDGRIFAREEIAADDLAAAKNRAFQILQSSGDRAYGIEIWSGASRLFPGTDDLAESGATAGAA